MDRGGNLYGTALGGGCGYGTVFKMTKRNGAWLFNPLYCFAGGNDGNAPIARVIFGPNGSLYGTTQFGGATGCQGSGCGTVFNLQPSASACKTSICPWSETVVYRFGGGADGAFPSYGDLVFDAAGNMYGTTRLGGGTGCGGNGCGVVFKLTPSRGQWTESIIYSFSGGLDGGEPFGGLVFDSDGNLYGTTAVAGVDGGGTVFKLVSSGSGWTLTTLHNFDISAGDGYGAAAALVFDTSGNLYGTTVEGGSHNGGTVFELTPQPGGSWTETILYDFDSSLEGGPYAPVTFDAAGNLYGTTFGSGADGLGNVFRLTSSGGGWSYSSLHDFTGGNDGSSPFSNVVFDTNGNLYGTASEAGNLNCNAHNGCGVVWEITP